MGYGCVYDVDGGDRARDIVVVVLAQIRIVARDERSRAWPE